jgi:hypothetical protein
MIDTETSSLLQVKQYHISRELFTKGYRGGKGPCTCTTMCCGGGVYVDLAERDQILAVKDLISMEMDETQSPDPTMWFEDTEQQDSDFPSGRCIGTTVISDKCAFLDKFGRCVIQMAAVSRGLHRWTWKPRFCVLYPLEITDNVIGFDDLLQEEQACCTVHGDFDLPLFEACKDELVYLIGDDGFEQIRQHYQTLAK